MMMKRALSPEEVVTARGVGGTKTDGGSQFIIIVLTRSHYPGHSLKQKRFMSPAVTVSPQPR